MAELEKAIKGLEICLKTGNFEECIEDCPYFSKKLGVCYENMIRDALSLLKAQEPRVMPADEIVLSAEPSKWLWVERKGEYCAEAFKAGKTISGLIAFDSETPGAFLYCEHPGEYGKTWRCWTSRPSDSERGNTPWE